MGHESAVSVRCVCPVRFCGLPPELVCVLEGVMGCAQSVVVVRLFVCVSCVSRVSLGLAVLMYV